MSETENAADDGFRVTPDDLGEPEAATQLAHTGSDESETES